MKTALTVAALWITLVIATLYGWVSNIIALTDMAGPMTGMMIARIAGIFVFPLGAVLGYF